jgi:5-formyltetrahydrofolate cyclo-ligase
MRGDLDLIILPALGVTERGDRLGYGGGFYDTLLPDLCPPAISCVVAFECQVVNALPTEAHDRRTDLVVTEARTIVND